LSYLWVVFIKLRTHVFIVGTSYALLTNFLRSRWCFIKIFVRSL